MGVFILLSCLGALLFSFKNMPLVCHVLPLPQPAVGLGTVCVQTAPKRDRASLTRVGVGKSFVRQLRLCWSPQRLGPQHRLVTEPASG